jgi:DNA-binding NarL/FixJ family response regulator
VSDPVRVAIVDDHELVSLALGDLVRSHQGLEFVGHAASVPLFLAAVLRAELVVLDLNLRDDSQPSNNVERLRAYGAQVLVLTSGENPFLIREVSRSGVLGIVRKSASPEDIIDAIAGAAAGQPIVTTEWAAALDSDPALLSAPLTDREREVLALYASGLPLKTVARRLGVSVNTIDDHIRRIRTLYSQLSRPANTKVDLYRRGMEDGILPYPTRP